MSTECEKCRPEFEKLQKQIDELKKRLAAYENAHTPYSHKIFKPRPKPTNRKRGRPKGHKGVTRPIPKPDRTVEKTLDKCPGCNEELRHLYKKSIIVEEVPKPQPVEVVKYVSNHYHCENCGEVVTKNENCPESGRFGINVLAEATLLKFEDRLPFRKIHETMKRQFNLDITPASIMNMTRNVFRILEPYHQELIRKIRISPSVYCDETSMRMNGINHWIWIFVDQDAVLCVIRKSRGKKVVKEILGKDYTGILVCDGWASYTQFGFIIQRCWSHLLREAKQLEKSKLYDILQALFKNAKSGKLSRSKAEERLRKIIGRGYRNKETVKFVKKIRNGFCHWFTFLEFDVEPTNNKAKRALREHVVIRKIIGGLRSIQGAQVHEVVMSCFATWKMHGLNLFGQLVSCLRS